ncbi:MAG: twin-arginine translocase subunit TatC [Dehalococcoidia bacterium]|nr:twin-arginine translocase subunit TatC [Dehalococcoidia bacterium]
MNDNAMSVLEHLGELKRRLIRVAIVMAIFIGIALANFSLIFETFTSEAKRLINDAGGEIIQLTLTEAWVAAAKLSIMAALVVALPYFLWEMAMFFKPGMKPNERKYIYLLVPSALAMFALGATFAYLVLIPRLFEFMLRFQGRLAVPQITTASVISLMVGIIFWLGIIAEIPIVMFLLAKIGLVSSRWLKTKRRWMILIAFVFGAIVTPTDPISQVIVAIPVMLLFEIGMLLVRVAERGRDE